MAHHRGRSANQLEIPAGARDLSFGFAALSLLVPRRVQVRYRQDGFDEEWIDAGTERSVRYTNLGPGDYAFRVIAANNDGVWNERGAAVAFEVLPRFYRHPAFVAGLVLLAGACVRGVYSWRVRSVRELNARLEAIVAEQRRTRRANRRLIEELEVKNAELERFNYTVSHDLKSPLVTIRGFLGMLEDRRYRRRTGAGQADRRDPRRTGVGGVGRQGSRVDVLFHPGRNELGVPTVSLSAG